MTTHKINVPLGDNASYPIIIARHCLKNLKDHVTTHISSKRFIIISHPSIFDLYGQTILKQLADVDVHTVMVDEGEQSKSISDLNNVLTSILENGVERSDCIIALGGGVIGDLAGFAASVCLRGIKLIHIPTTLLAQVDSSIGGKTGINHHTGKNLIGSFYQPDLILMDPEVLHTLSFEECRSGFAEVIKYGVIADQELFQYLEDNYLDLNTFDVSKHHEKWDFIIQRSAQNKVDVVSKDEKESNVRAILNFGHTIGHGLEAIFGNYDYRHGECVAFGMICASFIATKLDLLSNTDAERIYSLILKYDFKISLPSIDLNLLHKKMAIDKKVVNGTLTFILPTKVGHVIQHTNVSQALIEESILFLQKKIQ